MSKHVCVIIYEIILHLLVIVQNKKNIWLLFSVLSRGEFGPRQTGQLPRAVDLKGRLLSCQSY